MSVEEIVDIYLEVSQANRQLEMALLMSLEGGALLLSFGSRACFIPVYDREATLEAVAAFSLACGLRSEIKNKAPELN